MEAVISRVFPDGFHARCLKLPVDGFVAASNLPNDKYRYERRGQMLVGFRAGNQFRLGDRLTVKIAKVDLRERQLFLEVVKSHAAQDPKVTHLAAKPKKIKGTKNPARARKMSRRRRK
jgi:ribonuclease R